MSDMKKIILLFVLLIIPFHSHALIEVDITRGNLNPLPVAVSPLSIDEKTKYYNRSKRKKKFNRKKI